MIDNAINIWKEIYAKSRADNKPWLETGQDAISRLALLLGLGEGGGAGYGMLTQRFGMDDFEAAPGYQFRLGEGQKAIDRALAARGNYMSPAAVKALGEYNQNFASNEFNQAFQRDFQQDQALYDRLFGVSGQGQQASNILTNLGQNYASGLSNIYMQQEALRQAKQGGSGLGGSLFGGLANLAGGYFGGGGTLSGLTSIFK